MELMKYSVVKTIQTKYIVTACRIKNNKMKSETDHKIHLAPVVIVILIITLVGGYLIINELIKVTREIKNGWIALVIVMICLMWAAFWKIYISNLKKKEAQYG